MLEHFSEELNSNMSADTADNRLLHRAARLGELVMLHMTLFFVGLVTPELSEPW